MTRVYPNVHARVLATREAPAFPRRESVMDIWMNGTRFRVRDASGRDAGSILDDLSAPRGLGKPARTMEEIMDARSPTPSRGATELYGDLATNEGWVARAGEDRWPIAAKELAPAAEQILVFDLDPALAQGGESTCLGRRCITYRGTIEGEEDGAPFQSRVMRVIAWPYVIVDDVRDAKNEARFFFRREVIELEEGSVTDADLTP